MVINKEKNFISALLYIHNNEQILANALNNINKVLEKNFEKYEIICVNDCSKDNSIEEIKKFSSNVKGPAISIVNMSYYQGLELSMNAGVDLSIGDFVFEFDTIEIDYNIDTIMEVYKNSLKGFDIVNASPQKSMRLTSKLFYKIFNGYSNNPNQLKTETFRILSRRAINRVQAMSKTIPYRKAVYANCGLKMDTIYYKAVKKELTSNVDNTMRKNIALESLVLFTDIAYKVASFMTMLMMIVIILVTVYTVTVFATKQPVAGWTTTMLFLSVAFFGVFAILAIIIKYLSIIVDLIFKKQKYMIESIDKITK